MSPYPMYNLKFGFSIDQIAGVDLINFIHLLHERKIPVMLI